MTESSNETFTGLNVYVLETASGRLLDFFSSPVTRDVARFMALVEAERGSELVEVDLVIDSFVDIPWPPSR